MNTNPAVTVWPQLLDPLHALPLSALVATVPLVVVLLLMGVLQSAFWHSVLFAALLGLLACLQAYVIPGMVP